MKKQTIFVLVAVALLAAVLVLYQYGKLGAPPPGGTFGEGGTYVSLRFDDGWKSQLNAARLLAQYGVPGSIYIISDDMGQEGYMTWDEVRQVSRVMEIGGHTVSHSDLRNLTSVQEYEAEIGADYRALADRGFAVTTFVYPYGNYSPTAIDVIRKYYACASTQDIGANTDKTDPFLLKDFTIRGNNTLDDVARMITPNAWTILTFHDVGEPAPGANPAEKGNAITEAFFEKILQWLKTNDVRVITVAEGCKILNATQSK
jgi:peptidoglycan/xylan/chitin deacetylase (PgdA/CDA1 family)